MFGRHGTYVVFFFSLGTGNIVGVSVIINLWWTKSMTAVKPLNSRTVRPQLLQHARHFVKKIFCFIIELSK